MEPYTGEIFHPGRGGIRCDEFGNGGRWTEGGRAKVKLSIELTEVTAKRLQELASSRKVQIEELATACLSELAADRKTRRAILAYRRKRGVSTLADLGWLDVYDGQSVDEILGFASTESPAVLIHTIEEALGKRLAERPGWTGVERVVLALQAFMGEVNNGGFHQYFVNSSRQHAPVLPDDLRRIGCEVEAAIARRALDALALERVTAEEIHRLALGGDKKLREALHVLDEEFYALENRVPGRLLEYVRQHADAIHL